MKEYIAALDQGTTSSRCILFDHQGAICGIKQKEFRQHYPQPGWVEHDAMEIWHSQLSVLKDVLEEKKDSRIAGIGIANQRETTIVWDRATGEPVYPAIVWQCRRTAGEIERLKGRGLSDWIRGKTGLVPDAYFSASKIAWILDHVAHARERAERGELLFGTVDTWLIWNLTSGKTFVTDYSNASRTMLFNIHEGCWDDELLELFRVPACMLPEVRPSSEPYGYTSKELVGRRIPIAGIAGDQQAALFGQCCFQAGDIKNTYGTGCFLLMNTGRQAICSRHGLLTTVAASIDHMEYALEGSVFVGGAVVQWIRDELGLVCDAKETEACARAEKDTAGAYVVPAFTGLGTPYWNPYAKGTIVGLTRGCNRNHLIRAALESIAYQSYDVIRSMEEDAGLSMTALKVDGGASRNDFLMQYQADLINCRIERPTCIETTGLGAAYLAGLAVGYWASKEELRANWSVDRSFFPEIAEDVREKKLLGWHRAVDCALYWAQQNGQE